MTLVEIDITSVPDPSALPHYHERSIGPKVAFAREFGIFVGPGWVECHGRNGDCPLVRSLAKAGA